MCGTKKVTCLSSLITLIHFLRLFLKLGYICYRRMLFAVSGSQSGNSHWLPVISYADWLFLNCLSVTLLLILLTDTHRKKPRLKHSLLGGGNALLLNVKLVWLWCWCCRACTATCVSCSATSKKYTVERSAEWRCPRCSMRSDISKLRRTPQHARIKASGLQHYTVVATMRIMNTINHAISRSKV